VLTAKQAADHTGKSKAAILKAIKTGRLSASKDGVGEWKIDPSELFRVYQSAPTDLANSAPAHTTEHTGLAVELGAVREKLATLEQERQRERHQHEATIDDLRRRLDAEAGERMRLTAILTDQRKPEPPALAPTKPVEGRLSRAWSILRGKP
jgi:hypothetical protein